MLRFQAEWQEAPGVRDRVLAQTWARLEIVASDEDASPRWLTACIRAEANSVGRGVYGPLFPLAEWIVENWWWLLHEACRVPEYPGGRALGRDSRHRAWVQRHCLLAAREGGALPDLTFYRDGHWVVARLVADPEQDGRIRPVEFSGSGEFRIPPDEAVRALHEIVQTVVARLDGAADEDAIRLRTNWNAINHSRQTEADVCAWAGSLGIDPYDPAEASDDFIVALEAKLRPLQTPLRNDVLEATEREMLVADVDWVTNAAKALDGGRAEGNGRQCVPGPNLATSAHAHGYQKARELRQRLGLGDEPIPDLSALLHQASGWPSDPEIVVPSPANTRLAALVGKGSDGLPRVVAPRCLEHTRRFLLARAVYFMPTPEAESPLRLITRAYTWDQRASRAFAAELLVPADALRREIPEDVSLDDIDRLADTYRVSPMVVEHQIQNHHLGWIGEF